MSEFDCVDVACPYRIVRHQRHLDPRRKPMSLRVLDEMVASWHRDGTTPTYRALMDRVGLRSTGDIHFHMRELQRAGLVERASGRRVYVPTHKALTRQAA